MRQVGCRGVHVAVCMLPACSLPACLIMLCPPHTHAHPLACQASLMASRRHGVLSAKRSRRSRSAQRRYAFWSIDRNSCMAPKPAKAFFLLHRFRSQFSCTVCNWTLLNTRRGLLLHAGRVCMWITVWPGNLQSLLLVVVTNSAAGGRFPGVCAQHR